MAGGIGDLLNENVPTRTVMIRVIDRQEELHRDLLQMPHIETARFVGEEVAAVVSGADDACSELLVALVTRGHRIIEFKQQRANLEEIFMNVTKGAVQ